MINFDFASALKLGHSTWKLKHRSLPCLSFSPYREKAELGQVLGQNLRWGRTEPSPALEPSRCVVSYPWVCPTPIQTTQPVVKRWNSGGVLDGDRQPFPMLGMDMPKWVPHHFHNRPEKNPLSRRAITCLPGRLKSSPSEVQFPPPTTPGSKN
jgi:hypothetical protein